jgi:hypothetical protein
MLAISLLFVSASYLIGRPKQTARTRA